MKFPNASTSIAPSTSPKQAAAVRCPARSVQSAACTGEPSAASPSRARSPTSKTDGPWATVSGFYSRTRCIGRFGRSLPRPAVARFVKLARELSPEGAARL